MTDVRDRKAVAECGTGGSVVRAVELDIGAPSKPGGWLAELLAPVLLWVDALVRYHYRKLSREVGSVETQLHRELLVERAHRLDLEHKLNLLMEYTAPTVEAVLVQGVEAHWELKERK